MKDKQIELAKNMFSQAIIEDVKEQEKKKMLAAIPEAPSPTIIDKKKRQ